MRPRALALALAFALVGLLDPMPSSPKGCTPCFFWEVSGFGVCVVSGGEALVPVRALHRFSREMSGDRRPSPTKSRCGPREGPA